MSQQPFNRPSNEADQFRLLVQALRDYAIYMLDPEGFVSTWNAGACRIKGYSEAEIIGKHFSRFFTESDQRDGLPRKILALALRDGRYESEGWRVRHDGSRLWAVSVVEPIRDANGTLVGFGKVVRDITDRHETRQALAESERKFRLLVESVLDYAIFMIDPSGLIANWNSGAARIKGYAAGEVIGQHFSKFYTKEDRARGLPALALETARREGKYETEGWRTRKDGGRFWASVVLERVNDEEGNLIGFAKITRDITERRSAQEHLKESERQFRLLVSAVVDYAIYMLDPNGLIVNWNAGAQKIKGFVANEVIGSHFSRFYLEEDRASGKPARALYTAESEGRFEGEGWRVRKDGSRFFAHVVIDAIRDEDGALVGFAKITRDITERREAQLALEKAQERLAHAQKMEALGELTGGIAHDFNNLLTIIGGQARIIQRAVTDVRPLRAADAIAATVQRGASLTRQLLGFSRRKPLDPKPTLIADQLNELKAMLSTSLPANIQLVVSTPPETWPVFADASELELAVMNLVLNSRDALSNGGRITIATENVSFFEGKTFDGLTGDYVAICVSDNGHGIPKDIVGKVFDPFFTTKREGKGTGLGLSQVYGFARQSGGTVTIESASGIGTEVTIVVPRAGGTSRSTEVETDIFPDRIHGRILVVEDNSDLVEVTSALVMQLGYTVRRASDAEEALRILDGETFDLVFSDIMMPGKMDGLGLASSIRKSRPRLPVILASGSFQRVQEAEKMFPTIQKPYRPEELDSLFQRLLRTKQDLSPSGNLVDFRKMKHLRSSDNDGG